MRFLFLEPFYGGSHKDFADGLVSCSRHKIDLLTLPARFWKWRMRGAALHFKQKIESPEQYDGIITTDLMSLSDLKTLLGQNCPPALVYFHENQLTYPLAPGEALDVHFGFTDITTALAADRIIFNSHMHFDAFFSNLPDFLKMMPEYRPMWVVEEIRNKAGIIYPGCQIPDSSKKIEGLSDADLPPLIIWNHRWEFDKGPNEFFDALDVVLDEGLDFRLALLGENFQAVPKPFMSAKEKYGNRIVKYGYEESKEKYIDWMKKGAIIISTATQENFGMAVVEAMRYGCLPLLPNRLSYPEILPKEFHKDFLYDNQKELVEKLSMLIRDLTSFREKAKRLSKEMGRYSWETLIEHYDEELEKLSNGTLHSN